MRKIALTLALVLLLAACGGTGDDSGGTAATTTTVAGQSSDQMSEDTMADDQMTDDQMSEDTMADDSMADDSMTDDSMSDDSMTDDHMADDSMADDSMTDDSMTDDSMADDSMADDSMGHDTTTFTVTITNHSDTAGLATALSPGAYFVHTAMDTLFAEGTADRGEGLESLAEDGDPTAIVADLSAMSSVTESGIFNTPDGASEPGPALPDGSYTFTFDAVPGDYLSFATMFVQSNDWFFAPAGSGIALFTDGEPTTGDISTMVALWDAGTEVDETPGQGANQGARQSGPNTGDTESAPITAVTGYDGAVTVTITAG